MSIVESAEMVTRAAQLVTAGAVINIITSGLLIYASIKLRQAARNLKRTAQTMAGLPHD